MDYWRRHADTLARAEEQYGVPPQIIVAILGWRRVTAPTPAVTAYWMRCTHWDFTTRNAVRSSASSSAISALRTRGRHPRHHADRLSYAGAMGVPQFMPDSFCVYAVDFDGDGRRDIWLSPDDVIGSVANYFVKKGGWKRGARWRSRCRASPVNTSTWSTRGQPSLAASELTAAGLAITPPTPEGAKLSLLDFDTDDGTEYWIGLDNFYAIMRYNPRTSMRWRCTS